ncbi:hypothetical protein AKJ53_00845 [candidate division MSBL1 archaeon SCGC-AAA382F02]|uniref:Uncharacterized protein n=1 Tax=candidate division MSBL1 archaeon SCGC-AAA382F02 TaxID=1698282 RepID=A0A133VIJ9_9EURY|nr:hypothetical protein AKJ53_00845 [candidate division MSBL1 archaeon SCGC-AAA382F02]
MIQIPYGKIVILFSLLAFSIFVLFLWLRRIRIKKGKKKAEKIKEYFKTAPKTKVGKIPEKKKEIFNRIIKKINQAAESGDKVLELKLKEDAQLKIEAPDVIALQTPKFSLHKSFSNIRFQKIKRLEDKVKLYLKKI